MYIAIPDESKMAFSLQLYPVIHQGALDYPKEPVMNMMIYIIVFCSYI